VSPFAWAAASLAVVTGTLTQRATGGAFGMVVAPLIALVAPDRMPAGVLLIALAVTLLSTPRADGPVAWRELAPATAGRLLGALAAAGVVALAPDPGAVAVLVALSVLIGVAISLSGLRVALSPVSLAAAGGLSGLTGTLTSVGAPPMLLLYQHAGAAARPTLNAFFALGVAVSLAALALRGQVSAADAVFALSMAPAAAVGFALAFPAVRRLRGRSIRPLILGLATAASLAILLRALAEGAV
jgi:uncharacterized membrane protein YfcA